jgi:hypothetical protein
MVLLAILHEVSAHYIEFIIYYGLCKYYTLDTKLQHPTYHIHILVNVPNYCFYLSSYLLFIIQRLAKIVLLLYV